eukprot:8624058-Pyramimonas_sp.AAC.1
MIHGCPYLPGDGRIQSGLRVDSEGLILVSLKNLFRDNAPVCRSANDIIMTSGVNGRIPVSSLVQLIGIQHSTVLRTDDRLGQTWVNELQVDTQRGGPPAKVQVGTDGMARVRIRPYHTEGMDGAGHPLELARPRADTYGGGAAYLDIHDTRSVSSGGMRRRLGWIMDSGSERGCVWHDIQWSYAE